MAGVGVAHKLLKKTKKKTTIQIFDKATSVKTIYEQSLRQTYQAMSLPHTCQLSLLKSESHSFLGQIWPHSWFLPKSKISLFFIALTLKSGMRYPKLLK